MFIPFFCFWFLVNFDDEVTKIFVYILQGKMGKTEKNGKKITNLKWPKYQKPKNENMGWTKHKWHFWKSYVRYFRLKLHDRKSNCSGFSPKVHLDNWNTSADAMCGLMCGQKMFFVCFHFRKHSNYNFTFLNIKNKLHLLT